MGQDLKLQPQTCFLLLLYVILVPSPFTASSPEGRFHFLSLFSILEAVFREHRGHTPEFSSPTLRGGNLCLVTKPKRLQISSYHMMLSNGLKNSGKCCEKRKLWELTCFPSRSCLQHRREFCYHGLGNPLSWWGHQCQAVWADACCCLR